MERENRIVYGYGNTRVEEILSLYLPSLYLSK